MLQFTRSFQWGFLCGRKHDMIENDASNAIWRPTILTKDFGFFSPSRKILGQCLKFNNNSSPSMMSD